MESNYTVVCRIHLEQGRTQSEEVLTSPGKFCLLSLASRVSFSKCGEALERFCSLETLEKKANVTASFFIK